MFVIRFIDGTYLNRKANPQLYGKRRSCVDSIDKATTWTKRGHAKTALTAAVSAGELKSGTEAFIVEVTLVPKFGEAGEPVVVKTTAGRVKVRPR